MTQLLERAVAELSRLAPHEQDAVASLILAELQDERRWEAAFASSPDVLESLAAEARREVEAGEVSVAGFAEA